MGPTYSVKSKRYGNQREFCSELREPLHQRRAETECLFAWLWLYIDSQLKWWLTAQFVTFTGFHWHKWEMKNTSKSFLVVLRSHSE